MPETLQALAVLLVAVLPGAVAVLAYERHVGVYAAEFPERVVRFLVGSAVLFPLTAALAMPVWTHVLHVRVGRSAQYRNALVEGALPSPLWVLMPVAYVLVPMGLGWGMGLWQATRRRAWTPRQKAEAVEDLEAWDFMLLDPAPKVLIARLRSGIWVAGIFGTGSMAAPRTAKNRDLYLEVALDVNAKGALVRNHENEPVATGEALFLHAQDIELLRVVPYGQE